MQRLSYTCTPRNTAYKYCAITDIISKQALRNPEQEILVHRKQNGERLSVTYNTLERKSTMLAKYLRSIGVERHQHVAILGPNSLEWVIGEVAIVKTGAVCVHLSLSASDARDAMDIIQICKCKVLLLEPGVDQDMISPIKTLQRKIDERNVRNADHQIKSIYLRKCEGLQSYTDLQEILQINVKGQLPLIYPEDTAFVYCTSGSTGQPKLVKMNNFAFVNFVEGQMDTVSYKYFSDRPFSWLASTPLLNLSMGITSVFTDTFIGFHGSDPKYIWDSIKEENCSSARLMPYNIMDICEYKEAQANDGFLLKEIILSGQMIHEHCTMAFGVICSDTLNISYGATEVGIGTSVTIQSESNFTPGNVGRCLPGVEAKIIGEDGYPTPVGFPGEICIRSAVIPQGYFADPERNNHLFLPGGWVRSGDIGEISEDGNLVILGKIKDVISRGGRKLMPAMIEEIVNQIPGVREVLVVAVPDKRLYEEVCVCYVPERGADVTPETLKHLCESLFLKKETVDGMGEMPTYFVQLDEIPYLINGKPDKTTTKINALAYLGMKQYEN